MVNFNELYITADNTKLVIDVEINSAEYYDDVVLESIIIDTQDTYIENGPSSTPVFSHTIETAYVPVYASDDISTQIQEEASKNFVFTVDTYSKKHVRIILQDKDLLNTTLRGNMFFVYIQTTGTPDTSLAPEITATKTIGTVVNLYSIYEEAMKFVREIESPCKEPKNFVDFFLKVKALDLAIKTGNYLEAIRYWNKLFKRLFNTELGVVIPNCTCYGEYN